MNPQTIARVTGVLFLITYITSIPAAFFLYPPILNDPNYIVGAGADTSVRLGALLELILVVANIGSAVVLWPVAKRVNEILALGFVGSCHGKRLHSRRRPQPPYGRDVATGRGCGGGGRLARHRR